jgi:hypothetical protein
VSAVASDSAPAALAAHVAPQRADLRPGGRVAAGHVVTLSTAHAAQQAGAAAAGSVVAQAASRNSIVALDVAVFVHLCVRFASGSHSVGLALALALVRRCAQNAAAAVAVGLDRRWIAAAAAGVLPASAATAS